VSNLSTILNPGKERWILWTGGPLWGPSVVYWGKLIVFVLVVLFLSRVGLTPLGTLSSIALGVGLASLPVFKFWIPLVWLIGIGRIGGIAERFRKGIVTGSFVLLILLSLVLFYEIISHGLLWDPPMLIAGNRSSATALKWYTDYSSTDLVRPWVLSLPIEYWRGLSLAWALWLVVAAYRWLKASADQVRKIYNS